VWAGGGAVRVGDDTPATLTTNALAAFFSMQIAISSTLADHTTGVAD